MCRISDEEESDLKWAVTVIASGRAVLYSAQPEQANDRSVVGTLWRAASNTKEGIDSSKKEAITWTEIKSWEFCG
jgi:hypothetical protein